MAPYRPPKHSTEGSRAGLLRLMRHSIEKNPREGLTWPCAPSNLIVGGSLGCSGPSDLLQVQRRRRGARNRNPFTIGISTIGGKRWFGRLKHEITLFITLFMFFPRSIFFLRPISFPKPSTLFSSRPNSR
ncbi:hypothetical protein RHGRI_032392 [Rhododendron griersonianum]|uniref:Uncharacterized protein n=1 Tax=Rhododendron griersonianum TaxID=479676 RepID=A0AAV6IGG8_9ERIC|nr:hypothetical protein RHGRI_032392 [Rhododendron griersonianum]